MRQMKDSGYEWLGEVPANWGVYPARYAFTENRTKNINGEVTKALQFKFGSIIPKTNFDAESDEYVADTIATYTIVDPRTIMINGLNLNYDFKTLRVGMVTERGVITSAYLALIPDERVINAEFATLLFKGYESVMAFHNMGAGIRKTLGFKEFKNQPILIPPLQEQQRIVEFLQGKLGEIDAVIEQTRDTVEEYKRLKQTVITEAVTKGVRGEREMKYSGNEWISDIPAEWNISRIKYICEFEPLSDKAHLDAESLITYTPMECIKNGWFINNTAQFGSVSSSLTAYQDGDIVMAKVTPCFENGNIAVMCGLSSGFGLGSSELFVFRATQIETRYLFYWLRNDRFVQTACSTMTGTGGLKRVSPSFVKNCYIHLPPVEEQRNIVEYLDSMCAEFDRLIDAKNHLLSELESYRKSVVYEYVTGKKEVPACP